MRKRLWYNLTNIKFQAEYLSIYSGFVRSLGNLYSIFLSVTSASSVGAWAIWKIYPSVFASIIGIAQILHIIKPYIKIFGGEARYLHMSFDLEKLYLEYEKLWFSFENNKLSEEGAEKKFYNLREKALQIDREYHDLVFINFKYLINKAQKSCNSSLRLNFNIGENNE